MEEIEYQARQQGTEDRVHAYIVKLAEKMGIDPEIIYHAETSDRMLAIYEP